MEYGNQRALQQAKQNIEKWYPVVGVLESMNKTLAIMEKTVPEYFSGVSDIYFSQGNFYTCSLNLSQNCITFDYNCPNVP